MRAADRPADVWPLCGEPAAFGWFDYLRGSIFNPEGQAGKGEEGIRKLSENMVLLTAENIRKSYGTRVIFDDISVQHP